MKIKHKKCITYEMERYPIKCNECPAFNQKPYNCHNERGWEATCELGYMNGRDMRDFVGIIKLPTCEIETDNRVKVIKM